MKFRKYSIKSQRTLDRSPMHKNSERLVFVHGVEPNQNLHNVDESHQSIDEPDFEVIDIAL